MEMNSERFRQRADGKEEGQRLEPLPRHKQWLAAAAVLVASLALVAAGCGGSGSSDANSSSGSAAGSSSGSDLNERLADFSQCMRENGVPNFPDQRAVNGQVQLSLPPGLDPNSPQFQQAMEACRSLAPVQENGGGAGQQDQLLRFAKCMRKNGVPDFPDPTRGGLVTGSGIDPNSAQFQSALQACQSLLPAGATTTG
jgi:hypothetical protein